MEQIKSNKSVGWIPWLILLVCLLPSVCANFLYKANLINSNSTKQHGNLVTPALSAKHLQLNDINLDLKENKINARTWKIVYIPTEPCSNDCKQKIHELKNLKIALGREYHRANINTTSPQKLGNFSLKHNETYIIDPNDFLMMQYLPQQTTSDILKDVKHLLRYSNG